MFILNTLTNQNFAIWICVFFI